MNIVLNKTSGVKLVLENTAGQGSNLGYKFHEKDGAYPAAQSLQL